MSSFLLILYSEIYLVAVYPSPKVDKIEADKRVLVIKPYSPKLTFPKNLATAIPAANDNPLPKTFPKTAQNESLIKGFVIKVDLRAVNNLWSYFYTDAFIQFFTNTHAAINIPPINPPKSRNFSNPPPSSSKGKRGLSITWMRG